jgi:5-formyltetrahydrofolate cyclo-ligase
MEQKEQLRRAIKERLLRLSENDRRVESQVIVRSLRDLIKNRDLRSTVAAYFPYVDEPDIRPLMTELLEQKNVVCMPKVEANHLVMYRISSLEHIERNPVTNIPEPTQGSPIDVATIDIVIVPGRAFSKGGARLGRGSGGYDRWIRETRRKNPSPLCIGVCFECQLLSDIPIETHDERVDTVVTASKMYGRMAADRA